MTISVSDFVDIIMCIIAVVGIVFTVINLGGLRSSIRNAAISSLYGRSQEIRMLFLERPHLRKYFFDGVDIDVDDEDYELVVTLAELYLNLQEEKTVLRKDIGKEWPAWRESRDGFIKSSPIMQKVLSSKPERYSKDLVLLVRKSPI